MTRAIALALLLIAACGGSDDCKEVPCPPVDPLHSTFATCYRCN